MPRIGFLYPGHSAESDYEAFDARLGDGVELVVVHTLMREDAHRVDALLDVGSEEVLAAGARELADLGVDAAVWACTSGTDPGRGCAYRRRGARIQHILRVRERHASTGEDQGRDRRDLS